MEGDYKLIKGKTHQEDIVILNFMYQTQEAQSL